MIDIYQYTSFRRYLRDVFNAQKGAEAATNLTTFGRALGLSASALQMILSGRRNLTIHKLHEVAAGLRLNREHTEYFEALVLFEQAENRREKTFYQRRLKSVLSAGRHRVLRASKKEILSEWYLPSLILYLVDRAYSAEREEFEVDYGLLKKKFGLTVAQVDQLLETLIEIGALSFKRSDKVHIVFDKVGGYLTTQSYLLKVMEEAQQRLQRNFHRSDSYFEAHTLTISARQRAQLIEDYKALIGEYIAKEVPQTEDHVIQTVISLFPTI